MTKFSYFKNGIKNTIPNGEISIQDFLELIKEDSNLLKQIRAEPDKEKRKQLKAKLSYVTFSGVFKKRGNDKLIKSSGLASLDFDDVSDVQQLKQQLSKDKFTHCVFISPSGNGLKLLIKIPTVKNNEEYKNFWVSIARHFNLKEIDEGVKDISRACYLSYDPEPYFNPDSEIYKKVSARLVEITDAAIKGKDTDTSRSGFEFGKLCQLIKKRLTKETVFFEMNNYAKWSSSPESYKEHSYKKALKEIEVEKAAKKERKAAEIFTIRGQAKEFVRQQPVYYDSASIWWIWNKEEFRWEMSDDIDILNKIHSDLQVDTISSKSKSEIITALRQVGRMQKPKEPKKTWVQFKSRIFDFSIGEEFAATPEYLITNPLPYELGESEDTPTITKLFDEWVGSEYTQTLYEILAYACSSDQSLQTIIALTGSGSNGKGTFLQLLTNFIGKDNVCSSELKTLALRNFETSALYKKLVCQMGEVDAYDLKNTNLIKQLTGEDLIRYEFKGKNPFSDYSPTSCVIATNALPVTPDRSIGFYRRWLVVDFPNQFKVSRNILQKIPKKEYHNLARKILSILKELYKRGAFTKGGSFDERMQRYEERSNPVLKFVESFCDDEPGEKIKLQEFSKYFNEYLKSKHLRLMSVRQIGKALREEGFEVGARTFMEGETKTSAKVILNLKFVKNIKTTKTTKNTKLSTQQKYKGSLRGNGSSSNKGCLGMVKNIKTTKNTENKSQGKSSGKTKEFPANKKFSGSGVFSSLNKENTKTTKNTKLSTQQKYKGSLRGNGSSSNKGCLGMVNEENNDTSDTSKQKDIDLYFNTEITPHKHTNNTQSHKQHKTTQITPKKEKNDTYDTSKQKDIDFSEPDQAKNLEVKEDE